MKVSSKVAINAPKSVIWNAITDIDNAVERISGIEKVEIHHQPTDGVVGLKWTETRTMFGKTATETMWITDAAAQEYYTTRAENHGAIYNSTMRISEEGGQNYLAMEFSSQAQTFGAKLMAGIFGLAFKKATTKALHQDLLDIKNAVEKTVAVG